MPEAEGENSSVFLAKYTKLTKAAGCQKNVRYLLRCFAPAYLALSRLL
jgi:hypothetical protein